MIKVGVIYCVLQSLNCISICTLGNFKLWSLLCDIYATRQFNLNCASWLWWKSWHLNVSIFNYSVFFCVKSNFSIFTFSLIEQVYINSIVENTYSDHVYTVCVCMDVCKHAFVFLFFWLIRVWDYTQFSTATTDCFDWWGSTSYLNKPLLFKPIWP